MAARARGRLLLALPGAASARIFLELSGIQGESTTQGFENQIVVDSFQFGVAKRDNNKPASFSDATLTKQLDKSSPELMLRVANGSTIPSATVRFVREADPTVFLRYCLTGVRVNSFSTSSGGSVPSESFSLSYATIVQSYTQQGAGGGQGTVFSAGWDLLKNMELTSSCT